MPATRRRTAETSARPTAAAAAVSVSARRSAPAVARAPSACVWTRETTAPASVGRAGGRSVGDVAAFSAHQAVTGLILYSKLHSVMANAAEYDTDR